MKNKEFKWVVDVIKSCKTLPQIQSATKLVEIVFNKYGDQLDRFMLNKCISDTMDKLIINKYIIT